MIAAGQFWGRKRVLLTGHTGFKGSWLLLWLLELGADVWGYALEAEPEPNLFRQLSDEFLADSQRSKRFHHHQGDLADKENLADLVQRCQPQLVFHLAAQPLVRRSYADPLGTWATNVMGSLNLLEALKPLQHPCAVVMVTTDKVYENREWLYGYRENDRLGGHDPYSASKAAAEIAIASWRDSFCGTAPHQTPHLHIATARAGNVIGGGDWAADRIVPDAMRALAACEPIAVRNPAATRPWQHVLEPLCGYLLLAKLLAKSGHAYASAFNFGPNPEANRSVQELLEEALRHWHGSWSHHSDSQPPHEAGLLQLEISKARQQLGWHPRWNFATTVARTVDWYRAVHEGASPLSICLSDLEAYSTIL